MGQKWIKPDQTAEVVVWPLGTWKTSRSRGLGDWDLVGSGIHQPSTWFGNGRVSAWCCPSYQLTAPTTRIFRIRGRPVVGWMIFLKSDEKICANITCLVLMIHVVTWAADFHSWKWPRHCRFHGFPVPLIQRCFSQNLRKEGPFELRLLSISTY